MKQLKLNMGREEKIVNKKIKEEFSLKNGTLYGGYNLFSDYLASNGLDRLGEEETGWYEGAMGHISNADCVPSAY